MPMDIRGTPTHIYYKSPRLNIRKGEKEDEESKESRETTKN